MKRYKIVPACELISDLIATHEDPNGEWVKWKDHFVAKTASKYQIAGLGNEIERLKDEIRCLKTKKMQTYDEYIEHMEAQREREDVLKVKDVTECNCADMATGTMVKYPNMLMADWWVCPKHGYKKR